VLAAERPVVQACLLGYDLCPVPTRCTKLLLTLPWPMKTFICDYEKTDYRYTVSHH
jgi:hypothetical protein